MLKQCKMEQGGGGGEEEEDGEGEDGGGGGRKMFSIINIVHFIQNLLEHWNNKRVGEGVMNGGWREGEKGERVEGRIRGFFF